MEDRKIRFGANYVPSKKWSYAWLDFNKDEIREDLVAIRSLGMDHIRIHLIWQYFQPNINYVSEKMLDNLHVLLDIADENELDVEVTVLDGWLSGYMFMPVWTRGYYLDDYNIFTSPKMIDAEKFLFKEIANKIGNHKRFMGFDLGNEVCVMQQGQSAVSTEQADAWQSEMMQFVNEIAPNKIHVNGVNHGPWFSDFSFSKKSLSNVGSVTSIHSWILFTYAMELYKPLETGCIHLMEFGVELAKAYSDDVNRPVWIEEFGITKTWTDEKNIPEFIEKTIIETLSCGNVWGFTWWCSHDIEKKYKGFEPLEYELGLFDVNNKIKPSGEKIKEVILNIKANPIKSLIKNQAIVLPDDYFAKKMLTRELSEPLEMVGWCLGKQFMDYIDLGIRPALVLESKSKDLEYLKKRGITQLLEIK